MIRPSILRRNANLRHGNRPRQHPADVAHKRLMEVPARPGRQQYCRELRRQRVANIAPVDRLPHVFGDARHCWCGREVEREAFGAVEGEEEADWDFDGEGDEAGCKGRFCNVCWDVSISCVSNL